MDHFVAELQQDEPPPAPRGRPKYQFALTEESKAVLNQLLHHPGALKEQSIQHLRQTLRHIGIRRRLRKSDFHRLVDLYHGALVHERLDLPDDEHEQTYQWLSLKALQHIAHHHQRRLYRTKKAMFRHTVEPLSRLKLREELQALGLRPSRRSSPAALRHLKEVLMRALADPADFVILPQDNEDDLLYKAFTLAFMQGWAEEAGLPVRKTKPAQWRAVTGQAHRRPRPVSPARPQPRRGAASSARVSPHGAGPPSSPPLATLGDAARRMRVGAPLSAAQLGQIRAVLARIPVVTASNFEAVFTVTRHLEARDAHEEQLHRAALRRIKARAEAALPAGAAPRMTRGQEAQAAAEFNQLEQHVRAQGFHRGRPAAIQAKLKLQPPPRSLRTRSQNRTTRSRTKAQG